MSDGGMVDGGGVGGGEWWMVVWWSLVEFVSSSEFGVTGSCGMVKKEAKRKKMSKNGGKKKKINRANNHVRLCED